MNITIDDRVYDSNVYNTDTRGGLSRDLEVDNTNWCYVYTLIGINACARHNKIEKHLAFCLCVAMHECVENSQDGAAILMFSITDLEDEYSHIMGELEFLKGKLEVTINTVKRYGDNNYSCDDWDETPEFYNASLVMLKQNSKGTHRG